MEKIFIDKNGMISKKGTTTDSAVLKLLGNHIEIDKDFTLNSFFMMIKQYPDLINISEMIEPILEIVSEATGSGIKSNELDSLLFYKTIKCRKTLP